MKGRIIKSANNIYTLSSLLDSSLCQARIKGKVLDSVKGEYNPLVVGDIVSYIPNTQGDSMITEREERLSSFTRWNVKKLINQTICANMDQVVIVSTVSNPPFRPRFIDRAICCARNAEIVIAINKDDLEVSPLVSSWCELYNALGFKCITISAKEKRLDALIELLKGKTSAFVGQSGCGKSSIVNALLSLNEKTGEIVSKYDRGRHTTTSSTFFYGEEFNIIDTPGVREILVPLEDESLVKESFPELKAADCLYSSCLHYGEDGCAVPDLIDKNIVSQERYESYLRILESLFEGRPGYMRKKASQRPAARGCRHEEETPDA